MITGEETVIIEEDLFRADARIVFAGHTVTVCNMMVAPAGYYLVAITKLRDSLLRRFSVIRALTGGTYSIEVGLQRVGFCKTAEGLMTLEADQNN